MDEQTLVIKDLTKEFRSGKAVDGVSANISTKEFLCILGPDGAGKTTLLRLISGLEKLDKGEIFINGKPFTSKPANERPISLVSQQFALYPNMNVLQNIEYPLKLAKINKDERRKEIERVTEFLGIKDLLNRKPSGLSGGEQQRVAIAKGLVEKNDLYLFDEPFTNLDYKVRESLSTELKRIQTERDRTIIFAASDPEQALSMADTVWVMNRGRFVEKGNIRETYNRPQNLYTATYLGSPRINTFQADIFFSEQDTIILESYFFQKEISSDLIGQIDDEVKEVVVAIRPEDMYLQNNIHSKQVTGTFELIVSEILGSDSVLRFRYGEKDRNGNEGEIRVHVGKVLELEPGKELQIGFDPSDLLIYEAESGKLLLTGDHIGRN